MAKDLNRSIKIYIDHSDAMKKASDFGAKIETVTKQLEDLDKQGKKGTPEYKAKEKTLNQLTTSYDRFKNKLSETERILKNLSGVSRGELLQVQKELKSNLKNLTQGSIEYKATIEALIAVEKQLNIVKKEMNGTLGKNASLWNRATDGFNKYFGIVTSILAGITGLSLAFRKLSEDVAKMDDVYSDVMKTTGMTRDQVLDLNNSFKQMDTRTSREELNMLARDAGKLGLSGKKDILDFVEAGNQINVALGEDLGEGAIKNIGKMTDVYALSTKELEQLDLKGKMLAIGSAINELGASSTASEAYLVNFTQRLGGVASQAGISIQNILGYASALDQSGQAVEMSATALQKFLMKLMGEPAKFAKLAGLEVKEFNKLLQTDTNEAIKQVLQALSNKGGFQALIPVFKDMGLDGARAVGVLSALATNLDKVNTAQEISNKAFSEGTSITNEYSIKNNNLNAQLEKARKNFKDAALELGESLNPVLLTSTKWTTYLIKALPTVFNFFEKYGKYIVYLVTVGTAYVATLKLQTLWNTHLAKALSLSTIQIKLQRTWIIASEAATHLYWMTVSVLTGRLNDAKRSFIAFSNVLRSNPAALAVGIITALAGAIYLLNKRAKEQTALQKSQQNITKKTTELYEAQKSKIDILTDTVNNENLALDKRRIALDKLKSIIPDYHADLTKEGTLINNNKEAIEEYLIQLEKEIQLKAAKEELEELYRKKRNQKKVYTDKQARADSAKKASNTQISGQPAYAMGTNSMLAAQSQMFADTAKKELEDTEQAIKTIRQEIQLGMNEIAKINAIIEEEEEENPDPTTETKATKQKKELNLMLENLETKHRERLFDIKKKYINKEIDSESEYNQQLFSQEQAYYALQETLLTEYLKKVSDKTLRSDISKQIADIRNKQMDETIKYQEKLNKILLDANPEEKEKQQYANRLREYKLFGESKESLLLALAAAETEEEKVAVQQKYDVFVLLEKQHQDNMVKIRKDGANKKRATAEEEFENDFAERKAQLQKEIAEDEQSLSLNTGLGTMTDEAAFNAEVALQEKRISLIKEELAARKKAGKDTSRILKQQTQEELALTRLYVSEFSRRRQQYTQYANDMGTSLGNLLIGQQDALQNFSSVVLDILFDTVTQIITAEITKVVATGTGAIARATAESMATPGSAMTFGAKGFATAAILVAAITGAMVVAKTALKGLLGKKNSSSSSSGTTTTMKRVISTPQQAEGKYDVIGEQDGKLYRNVPFAGKAKTGIVYTPTLVAEDGGELVVSSPDLKALQKHVNYPYIVNAINDVRAGTIPQRATGKYDEISIAQQQSNSTAYTVPAEILQELVTTLKSVRDKKLDFNIYEFERKKSTADKARNLAKRK